MSEKERAGSNAESTPLNLRAPHDLVERLDALVTRLPIVGSRHRMALVALRVGAEELERDPSRHAPSLPLGPQPVSTNATLTVSLSPELHAALEAHCDRLRVERLGELVDPAVVARGLLHRALLAPTTLAPTVPAHIVPVPTTPAHTPPNVPRETTPKPSPQLTLPSSVRATEPVEVEHESQPSTDEPNPTTVREHSAHVDDLATVRERYSAYVDNRKEEKGLVKRIAKEISCDATQLSRLKSGNGSFPPHHVPKLVAWLNENGG